MERIKSVLVDKRILIGIFTIVHVYFLIYFLSINYGALDLYNYWVHNILNPNDNWIDWNVILGIQENPNVEAYPALAVFIMIGVHWLSLIFGASFAGIWFIIATLLNIILFVILLKRGKAAVSVIWFWLIFIVFAGDVSQAGLESILIPITTIAMLVIISRPILSSVLLSIGVWIKIWPLAIFLSGFLFLRNRAKRLSSFISSLIIITALLIIGILNLPSHFNLFGFITDQSSRGLQIEAFVAMPFMFMWSLNNPNYQVVYNPTFDTSDIIGSPIIDLISKYDSIIMGLIGVILISLAAILYKRKANPIAVFIYLSLALTSTLIVFNKVGSGNYVAWFIPTLIILILFLNQNKQRILWPVILGLGSAICSQISYHLGYSNVWTGVTTSISFLAVSIIALRNLFWLGLFIYGVAKIISLFKNPLTNMETITKNFKN